MFKNISDVKFVFAGCILVVITGIMAIAYVEAKKHECAQKPAVTQKK